MNIFQKIKSFFVRNKAQERKEHNIAPMQKVAPVKYEPKHWTRKQYAKIKRKRQISARSRMYNLMNA